MANMLRHRTCILLSALFVFCSTEGALGSMANSSLCNGICLNALHATLICEVAFVAPPCFAKFELCCTEIRVRDTLKTDNDETALMGNNVWSARASNNQGSVRQSRNVYMDIMKLIIIQALRAAVASEYKAIAERSRPAGTTELYEPTWPEENDRFKTVSPAYPSRTTSTTPYPVLRPPTSFAVTTSSQGHQEGPFPGSSTPAPSAEDAHSAPPASHAHDIETTTVKLTFPCPGNCMPNFLRWFCEATSAAYECWSGRICCLPPTTTTPAEVEVPACPGACIPPAISGLCKKPARLMLKTTTCDGNSICCSETPRLW